MQHDFNIANQGFPATRSDINNALAALASTSSGTSEPSTTYANQFWYDTTNNLLKFRNEADSAWITLAYLDQATNEWEIRSAVIQAVDSAGVIIKTDDGTARVTVADDGDVTFANDVTVSGNFDVSSGTIKLDGNYPTGTGNVALGNAALDDGSLSGTGNVAIGNGAMTANTTGGFNSAVGYVAMTANTTGGGNTAFGSGSLDANISGGNNVAIGADSLTSNTTASYNTAVGYQAGYSNTTGTHQTFLGYQAGRLATGGDNTGLGFRAGGSTTTGQYNTAVGSDALLSNTTASTNTAVGYQAGYSNTTGAITSAGYRAGYSNTTGTNNSFFGDEAGYANTTSSNSAYFGEYSGRSTTGNNNTFYGQQSGWQVTTGYANTILGRYNGNQDGLDIRTSSNNIVLSDGDGNPRLYVDNSGGMFVNRTTRIDTAILHNFAGSATSGGQGVMAILNDSTDSSADAAPCLNLVKSRTTTTSSARFMQFYANGVSTAMGGIVGNGASNVQFASLSDERLKENISSISGSLDKINSLRPVEFDLISSGEHVPAGFIAQEVEDVFPEYVIENLAKEGDEARKGITGGMSAGFVAHLVQAIKELSAKNDALEARITALEAN